MNSPPHHLAWHTLDASDAVARLQADVEHGLSTAEAAQRLQRYDYNCLPPPRRRPAWLRFLLRLRRRSRYCWLIGSTPAYLLAAVAINAISGFVQEGKAENALDSIRNMLSERATV